MGEVQLEIPARVEYLGLARQVVAAAAAVEPRFRDERIDDLRIAVSEATTNAIEAHADLGSDDRILIRCNLDDDRIEVEVLDRAGGFDPALVVPAPEAQAANRLEWERGLGLPLMKTLADETEIHSTAGGTAVRLVVYAPHAQVPGAANR
jgi:serine/threonine-protein kinase RsbW